MSAMTWLAFIPLAAYWVWFCRDAKEANFERDRRRVALDRVASVAERLHAMGFDVEVNYRRNRR